MKRKSVHGNEAASLETGRLSSGNVFEDLGFADAETELVKADLVLAIADRLERLQMSQRDAAERLGTTQPKVSMLLRGQTKDFSVSKLMELLNRLSCDVQISISPAAEQSRGTTRVVFGKKMKEAVSRLVPNGDGLVRPAAYAYAMVGRRALVLAEGKPSKAVHAKSRTKTAKPRLAIAGTKGGARHSGTTNRGRSR